MVGHFVDVEGGEVYYDKDPDLPLSERPFTYLIAHRHRYRDYDFADGSVIVDPWCELPPSSVYWCDVVWYGRP